MTAISTRSGNYIVITRIDSFYQAEPIENESGDSISKVFRVINGSKMLKGLLAFFNNKRYLCFAQKAYYCLVKEAWCWMLGKNISSLECRRVKERLFELYSIVCATLTRKVKQGKRERSWTLKEQANVCRSDDVGCTVMDIWYE